MGKGGGATGKKEILEMFPEWETGRCLILLFYADWQFFFNFIILYEFWYSCQDELLKNVKVGEKIARNQALKENVFMMVVCVELRIPLFVVGKPGSSKSLAKAIVADAMQGAQSINPVFKTFKEVNLFFPPLCG